MDPAGSALLAPLLGSPLPLRAVASPSEATVQDGKREPV